MKGVHNSECNPAEFVSNSLPSAEAKEANLKRLYRALKEHDYLIALLCTAFFESVEYNPEKEEFGDITPNRFRHVMNIALEMLENDVWIALRKAETYCAKNGIPPFKEASKEDCEAFQSVTQNPSSNTEPESK